MEMRVLWSVGLLHPYLKVLGYLISAYLIHLWVNNSKLSTFDKTEEKSYFLRHSGLSSWLILYHSLSKLTFFCVPQNCLWFWGSSVPWKKTTAGKINTWRGLTCFCHNYKTQHLHIYPFYREWENLSESFRCLCVSILDCPHFTFVMMWSISTCVTYFSISLFLQVRGAEEEEHGVLESVLLLSPLLVEGISANTVETDNRLTSTLRQQNVQLEQKHCSSIYRHWPTWRIQALFCWRASLHCSRDKC